MPTDRTRGRVLDAQIDVLGWADAILRPIKWADQRESRYVAVCNVHVVVTASRDIGYRQIINDADMAAPDGAPVAWMLRRLGFAGQCRISGPDLMWALCERCAIERVPVYFIGGKESTLTTLRARLRQAFPALEIVGSESPPFRKVTPVEDAGTVERINASGARIVFVGLGCPAQERWMAAHRGRVQAVMIGVGAAFDFHAGTINRAPAWMQQCGLEWLHRLLSEPRRLWRRYLATNTLFILGAARQLMRGRQL